MICVYLIENVLDGKKFVGQTKNVKYRSWRHFYLLQKQKHNNHYLQSAYNKHGRSAFTFKVLVENLPENYGDDVERGVIATLRTLDRQHGYNLSSGGRINFRISQESIEKQRQSITKTMNDPNFIHKSRGTKLSDEKKKKLSERFKGRTFTKEQRENISKGLKGKPKSAEHVKNLRAMWAEKKARKAVVAKNV